MSIKKCELRAPCRWATDLSEDDSHCAETMLFEHIKYYVDRKGDLYMRQGAADL